MKNKKHKSWKYLETRKGYFGHFSDHFCNVFVENKGRKLVEGGSAGVASDPKSSTTKVSTCVRNT